MQLDVYIERSCESCERAIEIAEEIDRAYPAVAVQIIDMAEGQEAGDVFAVPTFVLDGDVFSLGNPKRADLHRAIETALVAG